MNTQANVGSLDSQDIIPYESEIKEAETDPSDTDIEPQISEDYGFEASDGNGYADGAATENTDKAEYPFLKIRYNHKDCDLSRQEAITAAQKGMKYGEIADRLESMAQSRGCTATEFLDLIASAERRDYENSLSERAGYDEDTVQQLMKLYDIEQSEKYGEALRASEKEQEEYENDLNHRLAEEFRELKSEFPNISSYGDLPTDVRKAAENGKELMTAYLLHRYREEKKISAANAAAQTAEWSAAGSMSGETEAEGADIACFKAGFWR